MKSNCNVPLKKTNAMKTNVVRNLYPDFQINNLSSTEVAVSVSNAALSPSLDTSIGKDNNLSLNTVAQYANIPKSMPESSVQSSKIAAMKSSDRFSTGSNLSLLSSTATSVKLISNNVDISTVRSSGTPTLARRAIDTFDKRIETVDLLKRSQDNNEQLDNVDVPMETTRPDSPSVYPEKSCAMGIIVVRGKRRSSNVAVEHEVDISPESKTLIAPLAKRSRNTPTEMSRTTCIGNAEGSLHAVSMPIDSSKIL